ATPISIITGTTAQCRERYAGHLLGISIGAAVDTVHFPGLPVSTTQVSVGSIFGVAIARGGAGAGDSRGVIRAILTAWVTTLPLAAVMGAAGYTLLR
ncbi:MAG: inorganic phosphate transporter, partial [Gemmatimonadales bacterium]|nr:inorganic phosphate transporter [Gemmatimonadales bacterium]